RTEIENLHRRPVRLTVMERLPVSRNERLKVEAVGLYKEPSHTEVDGRAGVLGWDLDLAAGESRVLEGGFEARWPEGQQPTGL
ncbi:MAG: DUF4139 domain-containing protein, partial [Magnetospirillum sp.]|nr:DUF4139 domain-containing protein [Magnetospirillum sp.]